MNSLQDNNTSNIRLEDDFFGHINNLWIASTSADINTDMLQIMAKNINDTLKKDLELMLKHQEPTQNKEYICEAIKFYELYTDIEAVKSSAVKDLLPYINTVLEIKTLDELIKNFANLAHFDNYPFLIEVGPDFVHGLNSKVFIGSATPIAPISSEFDADSIASMYETIKAGITKILLAMGKSEEQVKSLVNDALAFDKILMKTPTNVALLYSDEPDDSQSIVNAMPHLDFKAVLGAIFPEVPAEVKIISDNFIEFINTYVTEDKLEIIKHWICAKYIAQCSHYLSAEFAENFATCAFFAGLPPAPTDSETAAESGLSIMQKLFPHELGLYFGKTYFDERLRSEITCMIKNLIDEYKIMLQETSWLSQTTRNSAIKKLDAMEIVVGYNNTKNVKSSVCITSKKDGGSLVKAYMEYAKAQFFDSFSYLNKATKELLLAKVDTQSPYEANAQYNMQTNTIFIPFGMLQTPYFNPNDSTEQKYASLGVVIGHEISHSFDETGSSRDEKGNPNSWWTQTDFEAYHERTQAMVKMFDGKQVQGFTVSGEKTLNENIADNAGFAIALKAVKKLGFNDMDKFFKAYANANVSNLSDEILQFTFMLDAHAPNKLRVNLALSNCDEFYETYDIKETDNMYISPEKRVAIW